MFRARRRAADPLRLAARLHRPIPLPHPLGHLHPSRYSSLQYPRDDRAQVVQQLSTETFARRRGAGGASSLSPRRRCRRGKRGPRRLCSACQKVILGPTSRYERVVGGGRGRGIRRRATQDPPRRPFSRGRLALPSSPLSYSPAPLLQPTLASSHLPPRGTHSLLLLRLPRLSPPLRLSLHLEAGPSRPAQDGRLGRPTARG